MKPELIVACLSPLLFPAIWCLVLWILSKAGGWSRLGQFYRDDPEIERTNRTWQSAKLGWVGYNNCLTIGVSDAGLHLSVPLPFRVCHPNLLIPWDQFHDTHETSILFMNRVKTTIGSPTITTLTLPPFVKKEIAKHNSLWFSDDRNF